MAVVASETSRNVPISTRLESLRGIHSDIIFYGKPQNAIMALPEDVLKYIISLLSDETPILPDQTISKWEEVIIVLQYQRIIPLLFYKINQLPADLQPPKEIVDRMKYEYLQSFKRTFITDRQMLELLNAFKNEGITVIVLKGAAISRYLYPDPATRSGEDIDLLVFEEDIFRSRKALTDIGYIIANNNYDKAKHYFYAEEYGYKDSKMNYKPLEVHWKLYSSPIIRNINLQEFFVRAKQVNYKNLTFSTLDPVDMLIYFAIHMVYKHNTELKLIWINDISYICKRLTTSDWEQLRQRCASYDARIAVEYVLKMAKFWTGLSLPDEYSNYQTWPAPSDDESKMYNYSVKGRENPANLFKFLWPKDAPVLEKIKVLGHLLIPNGFSIRELYPDESGGLLSLLYMKYWFNLVRRLSHK